MISAFDVHYAANGEATAAAVLFHEYTDEVPSLMYSTSTGVTSRYIPGEFYRRELPCILRLLDQFREVPEEMIVDGFVMLGSRPGLGRHLFESLGGRVTVIGVAKSKYRGWTGVEVLRGKSKRPLYITSAGVDPLTAAGRITSMHGPHRIPTLLKYVDQLARKESLSGAAFL